MCLKIPLSLFTMLRACKVAWAKLYSFSLNIVESGSGEKQNIVQIAIYPIIFVSDCLKNCQKLKVWYFIIGFLNHFPAMRLPITSQRYQSDRFSYATQEA